MKKKTTITITMFLSSISQKKLYLWRNNKKRKFRIFYFPIENDRPVELCIGNVVGSTIVHSYQTWDDEQQRQKLTFIVELASNVIGS